MSPSKIVVVTGCTQGLGYYCVKSLADDTSNAYTIVLACRNVTAASEVAASIRSERSNLVVLPTACDLSSLKSVREYSAALSTWLEGRKIDSLVNNAGIGGSSTFKTSADGYELIWATNHLGHFLLTTLLLPSIASTGRIVNVSSEVHDPAAKTPLPDPAQFWPKSSEEYNEHLAKGKPVNGENASTSGRRYYSRSKLSNVMFTNELARRLTGASPYAVSSDIAAACKAAPGAASCSLPSARGISVIAMNPGLMLDSGFVAGVAGKFAGYLAYGLAPILRWTPIGNLMRSAPESGVVLAKLAVQPLPLAEDIAAATVVKPVTAAYFNGHQLQATSDFSLSKEAVLNHQVDLWLHSIRWAGVTDAELKAAGFA